MPAQSGKQLRKAYAEARKGKAWAKHMIAKTPRKTRQRMMRKK
jgi:hypothetical protein